MLSNLTHMLLCVDIIHKPQLDLSSRIISIILVYVFLVEIYSY